MTERTRSARGRVYNRSMKNAFIVTLLLLSAACGPEFAPEGGQRTDLVDGGIVFERNEEHWAAVRCCACLAEAECLVDSEASCVEDGPRASDWCLEWCAVSC